MRDLTDVLGAAVDARALALDGLEPAAGLAGLRTRVRRRRAVRHTVEAVAVLPVVAAVGVGGWLLLGDRHPVPPVVSPNPTSTPTDTAPDPTPTPTPTPTIARGDPITEPGLPTYYEMPEGLLERATTGWVLAVYEPMPWFPVTAPTTAVVVLASPDGLAYEVTRWDPRVGQADGSWVLTDLLDWRAGDTTALVTQTVVSADGRYASAVVRELDMLTGAVRDVSGHEDDELVAAGDTVRVWHDATAQTLTFEAPSGTPTLEGEPWSRWVTLGPDERYALVEGDGVPRVLDVASGEAVGPTLPERPEGWCEPVSWWTASSLLLECLDQDPGAWEGLTLELHPRLVTLPLGAASDEAGTQLLAIGLGDPEPWQWGNAWVADGVVVVQATRVTDSLGPYSDACADGAYLLRDGVFTELPRTDARDFINLFGSSAAGGRIVVGSTGGCSGDSAPSMITGYDPTDLSATVMLGLPSGDENTPGGTTRWWDGPASWVIGR